MAQILAIYIETVMFGVYSAWAFGFLAMACWTTVYNWCI